MPLPYSEKISDFEHAIQRLSGAQMIAIHKKLTDQPISAGEQIEIDRVILAIENPTPFKPDNKTKK
jgi:hypothetical protein